MGALASTLRRRDPHNQTLAICLLLGLTLLSRSERFSSFRAYTVWNCTAVLANFALRAGWERPLVCNSMAIWAAYRTASADAHSDLRERSKLGPVGYFVGDMAVHLAPVLSLVSWLVRHKKPMRPQHGAFSMLAQFHFAFSQAGKLDVGEIYVPHGVVSAWAAGILGHMLTPWLVNDLITGGGPVANSLGLLIAMPYLLKKLGAVPIVNRHTIAAAAAAAQQQQAATARQPAAPGTADPGAAATAAVAKAALTDPASADTAAGGGVGWSPSDTCAPRLCQYCGASVKDGGGAPTRRSISLMSLV